jgi:hypothetical protein
VEKFRLSVEILLNCLSMSFIKADKDCEDKSGTNDNLFDVNDRKREGGEGAKEGLGDSRSIFTGYQN